MKINLRLFCLSFMFLVLGAAIVSAQAICRLPQEADFIALEESCKSVGINTTCVAQGEARVTTADGERTLRAGDRIANQEILALDTTDSPEFPLIYSRTMANLPASYASNPAIILISGPTRITDADVSNRFVADPVVVTSTVTATTSVLSFPPDFGQRTSVTVGTLESGATVEMDVRTADGSYVRISYLYPFGAYGERASGWVASDQISDAASVAQLPVLAPGQATPLQNLVVQPLAGCNDVQVIFQSPSAIHAEFTLNGLPYVLSSIVAFWLETDASGNMQMVIIPVMGSFILYDPEFPDDPTRALIVAPSTLLRLPVTVEILEDGTLKIEVALSPETFDAVQEEYQAGLEDGSAYVTQDILNSLQVLSLIDPGLLSYEIFPPVILVPSGIGNPIPVYGTTEPPSNP
jgi:hypothetical protein